MYSGESMIPFTGHEDEIPADNNEDEEEEEE